MFTSVKCGGVRCIGGAPTAGRVPGVLRHQCQHQFPRSSAQSLDTLVLVKSVHLGVSTNPLSQVPRVVKLYGALPSASVSAPTHSIW